MIHAEAFYIQFGARIAQAPTRETFERRLEALRHVLQQEEKNSLSQIRYLIQRGMSDARSNHK